MSKKRQLPPLKIVQWRGFRQKWREMQAGEVRSEAFAKAAVIEWPEDEQPTPAQERFHAVRDEILNHVFDDAMPTVAEAFVKVSREVLARERRRQK